MSDKDHFPYTHFIPQIADSSHDIQKRLFVALVLGRSLVATGHAQTRKRNVREVKASRSKSGRYNFGIRDKTAAKPKVKIRR
ncbi:hypothetical protein MYX82_08040 [Acidobacteria bacterium AH-259-D05]|nr:hypothetical protein [Acidobacteria bacterium AH-259-D05]